MYIHIEVLKSPGGNDQADKLATQFMNQTEKWEPLPYFITGEVKFLAFYREHSLTETFASGLKNKRNNDYMEKLKVKVERLFRRFPQRLEIGLIERMDGKA